MNHKFDLNTILLTKDGRIIGNAIIVGFAKDRYKVKTDYGNIVELREDDINNLFYIAFENLPETEKAFAKQSVVTHKNYVQPKS